ncbi:hypothetical protein B0H17DRAFT_1136698 [Mycena rosella]|uniref:Uncharacterized protein n=1 Tax=Mycena rosella TaxID=1033263 RepID=A0AAD7DAE7_MYCRO|nr:hypothetical protein B0H17DRAFT_1136698 [Mycena rosella]
MDWFGVAQDFPADDRFNKAACISVGQTFLACAQIWPPSLQYWMPSTTSRGKFRTARAPHRSAFWRRSDVLLPEIPQDPRVPMNIPHQLNILAIHGLPWDHFMLPAKLFQYPYLQLRSVTLTNCDELDWMSLGEILHGLVDLTLENIACRTNRKATLGAFISMLRKSPLLETLRLKGVAFFTEGDVLARDFSRFGLDSEAKPADAVWH